jgi:hypothetical protein
MTDKDRPQLPAPAWFTIEDVAQRWGCKIEQVIHYGETGMLRISVKPIRSLYIRWSKRKTKIKPDTPWKVTSSPMGIGETDVRAAFANDIFPVFFVRHPVKGKRESDYGEIGSFCKEDDPVCFTRKDLVITTEEIDRFEREYRIGAHAGELPAPEAASNWPWGEHETELLRHLAAAAKRFWVNVDPGEQDTAPVNADVADFLKKRGVSDRVAGVMATILRADNLPAGRKG